MIITFFWPKLEIDIFISYCFFWFFLFYCKVLFCFPWNNLIIQFSSVQSLSCDQILATPWTAEHQASLSITNSQRFLKLMSIESVMLSNHLILCHPLLLLCRPLFLLPSILPSIRVFSNESLLHIRWPKYWSFSFSISPSKENQDWFPLG